jgi:hypothetical protein
VNGCNALSRPLTTLAHHTLFGRRSLGSRIREQFEAAHTALDNNEEGPFPNLQSLLLAHWTSVLQHLEDKIKKLILHFFFFCSITSLLSRTPDPKDMSKVQIRIRAFLQSKKTAVTALVKLLPPSHAF